ncbi:NADH-quinone oxidoreductase subunit A [Deinobacterium chartae]|uniref:NADH-quinone oxidoreductase subunit A n=2 Tax=Deinobacterium chartae TaxID=521158 RepID=A0A841HZ01_9DEIO|nr:NADH-quinone oxidoreductase subunit A [Deinobacterium chartae]
MGIEYANVLIMLLVAGGIGALALIVSALLGPKKGTRTKLMPYESGNDPTGTARERFPVHFYLVAMLFIVFDIEVAFFYPLAVAYGKLGAFAFWEALTFVLLVLVGYVYILKKGVLEWR